MADLGAAEVPVAALFEGVVGQSAAVAQLRASARQPVHAYLLHGPPGSGKREAVRGFAVALLCPGGGCGTCSTCRRALAGTHPDLVVMERSGASLSVEDARTIGSRAQRRPMEASRQVLVVTDIHLAILSAPALLKAVEEPPDSTVFVLVADDVPPTLATIASRCVKVVFDSVPVEAVSAWLVTDGVSQDVARSVAAVSGGRLDRAKLLATDPGFAARVERWRSVPARLDGTGAAACVVAAELLKSADEVLGPLREQHAADMAARWSGRRRPGPRGFPAAKRWRTNTNARSAGGGPTN